MSSNEGAPGRRAALKLAAGGALAGLAGALAAHSDAAAAMGGGPADDKAPAVIGVAAYHLRPDGVLEGIWTIEAFAGRLGTEVASGGTPGRLPGSYDVLIHDADGRLNFEGTLTIVALQSAYQMTWTGNDGSRYEGLGLQTNEDVLSAVYWGPVR